MKKREIGQWPWTLLPLNELHSCPDTKQWVLKAQILPEPKGDKVLMLHIYRRNGLIEENCFLPDMRVFQCEDDYITQQVNRAKTTKQKYKWLTGGLDKILDYNWWQKTAVVDTSSEQCIRKFLKLDSEEDVLGAINTHQEQIRAERLTRSHKAEEEKIDEALKDIQAIPPEFATWVDKEVLYESRYIYYYYKKGAKVQHGYCTHCHQEVSSSTARHNAEGVCPKCGVEIVYKAEKKAGYFCDRGEASLLQKLGDDLVERRFWIEKTYSVPRKPSLSITETSRFVYSSKEAKTTKYVYGTFRSSHKVRWCHELNSDSYYKSYPKRLPLYVGNLEEALEATPWKYCALKEMAEGCSVHGVPVVSMGHYLETYRETMMPEYLVKLKLYTLAQEYTEHRASTATILSGNNLREVLKVSKEKVPILQELNGGINTLNMVRSASEYNHHVTADTINLFIDVLGIDTSVEVFKHLGYGTPKKILNYIKKQANLQRKNPESGMILLKYVALDWIDYIRFGESLDYPLEESSVSLPLNLKKAHDVAEERWKVEKSKERRENLKKLEKETTEFLEEVGQKYNFQSGELEIMAPKKLTDIVREGHMLGHCVHGRYVEDMADGKTTILFIRHISEPEKPFYTVEVTKNTIRQCRGRKNAVATEEVQVFLDEFKRKKLNQQDRKAG